MPQLTPQQERLLRRRILFTPLESKEALHDWILSFLGMDIPDSLVDETSTSTPMQSIWEIYDRCRRNEENEFSSILSYASRMSFKTLGAAILEVLMVFHLGRSVAHMAAIKPQSQKAQEYVKKFLRRPVIKDFVVGNNQTRVEVVRYEHRTTRETLCTKEWQLLPDVEQDQYEMIQHYITIVVCTMAGANSEHVPFMCIDGETGVLVRGGTRTRKTNTARGIFNKVAGLPASGRPPAVIYDLDVREPAEVVEVLSFNFGTGAFEFKPIVAAHRKTSNTIKIVAGDWEEICTIDHPLYVLGRGFVEASEVAVGDCLVRLNKIKGDTQHAKTVVEESSLQFESAQDDPWEQVLLGSLLGDGAVYRKEGNNAYFKEQHCLEQARYLAWKKEILSQKVRFRDVSAVSGYTGAEMSGISSGNSPLFNEWKDFRRDLPQDQLDRLGPLGLAVWYMDDGCDGNGLRFSTEGFTAEQNERLAALLKKKFDIDVSVGYYERDDKRYAYLHGTVSAKRRFVELCGKFFHPDMAYKIDMKGNQGECSYCGGHFWFVDQGSASKTCGSHVCRLLRSGTWGTVRVTAVEDAGERVVYDFTVADNHNFFANGVLNKNCVDEVDVVTNPAAYEESKAIPDTFEGKIPVTLLTSTRKFSYGLVQKEIDEAPRTGLEIRHWNILDVTEACPKTRHQPELPRTTIYRSDKTLRAISQEEYDGLPVDKKEDYVEDEGYAGCLSNCKLFAVCKGRLATQQLSTSNLLKKIRQTEEQFRRFSPDMAKAQLLCWKPSTEGLIYARLDPMVHLLTPAQIAEKLTGDAHDRRMTKAQLLSLLETRNVQWFAGLDWGYVHAFSVIIGFRDGNRMFIVECVSQSFLEIGQKIELCNSRVKPYDPVIFGDPEDRSSVETFRKAGFKMRKWSKQPGSVLGGIEAVRLKLWPAVGQPELFFLAEDDGVAHLFQRLNEYHWTTDAAGRINPEVPDEENDDECDALRYLIMNVFAPKGKVTLEREVKRKALEVRPAPPNYFTQIMEHVSGQADEPLGEGDQAIEGARGRKGAFSFDFG